MHSEDPAVLIRHIEQVAEEEGDHTAELLPWLEHAQPSVREATVWALWSGSLAAILEPLLKRVEADDTEGVRAAAVSVLGRFVYEGLMLEPEERSGPAGQMVERVQGFLREMLKDESKPELLRRRALESLAFAADDEIEAMIEAWWKSSDELYRKSAAFAMGRADVERFSKYLMKALDDPSPMVRLEAIRSIGELGLKKGLPKLITLAGADEPGLDAHNKQDEQELAVEAIQALGQIGGAKAEAALRSLAKGKGARAEAAREALEELSAEK